MNACALHRNHGSQGLAREGAAYMRRAHGNASIAVISELLDVRSATGWLGGGGGEEAHWSGELLNSRFNHQYPND